VNSRKVGLGCVNYRWRIASIFIVAAFLHGCVTHTQPKPGIGEAISWSELPDWESDRHNEAWPALLQSCNRLKKKAPWTALCQSTNEVAEPDAKTAKLFFETWFSPHPVFAEGGKTHGLITGYYEPILRGSLEPGGVYQYPLYRRPDNLLKIDLGDRFPELKNKRLRGRVVDQKVIPFYDRQEIESDRDLLAGNELLWLDSRDDAFFLHIQGSGRVSLSDGSEVGVGYADQNGQAYKAIGKVLVDRGALAIEDVTLFSIRRWLNENPEQAESVLNENPSYVFFVMRDEPETGPVGSLNVPLTAGRSIAIDPKLVDLGVPIWLTSHFPGQPEQPLNRLVLAQDTGGAIKGNVRADVFWGTGEDAEQMAGLMKSPGQLYVLLPKSNDQ